MREMTSVIDSKRENDVETRFLQGLILVSESKSKNTDALLFYSAEVFSFCLIDVREEIRNGLLETKDIVE
jgi:hypothetical protein